MEFLSAVVLLFFILDPFGNLPLFHSVLKPYDTKTKRRILIRESLIALVILQLFVFLGNPILQFLGLKQSTLSISGGVMLFLIALGMIFPQRSVLHEDREEEPFIVPLAIPYIAGPSSLTFILLLSSKEPEQLMKWALVVILAWLPGILLLLCSDLIFKWIGQRGSRALERLMGMLLVLISIQMILDGMSSYFKPSPTHL